MVSALSVRLDEGEVTALKNFLCPWNLSLVVSVVLRKVPCGNV